MTTEPYEFDMPDRDKIANGLVAVDGTGHVVRNLYPQFIALAGQTMRPVGVALFVITEVTDYVGSMRLEGQARDAMFTVQYDRIHRYVRAMVDDERGLSEALAVLAKVGISVDEGAEL